MNEDLKKVASVLQYALLRLKEVNQDKPLAKNEVETSASSDGAFSIEFGTDIPSDIRKSAVGWLTKKGFLLTEDNGDSMSFVKDGTKTDENPVHIARKRWAI